MTEYGFLSVEMAAAASGVSAPVAASMRNSLRVPARSLATYKTEAVRRPASVAAGAGGASRAAVRRQIRVSEATTSDPKRTCIR